MNRTLLENAIGSGTPTPSDFDLACRKVGVKSEDWTHATDAQLVALALQLKLNVE